MSKNFNRERSNGIAQGREYSRSMRKRIAELEAQRLELVEALREYKADSADVDGVSRNPVCPRRHVHDAFIEFLAKIDKEIAE